MKPSKTKAISEFGDFQTPVALALDAAKLLVRLGIEPRSIIEPTCGKGSFIIAAATCFPNAQIILGVDINPAHLAIARAATSNAAIDLQQGDFFTFDWRSVVKESGQPWLVIGNPPWVTTAKLGAIDSNNMPEKSNFHRRSGIDAITGKSNFDISEWMLLRYLNWLDGQTATIAILCKTTVARKTLLHIWKKSIGIKTARIYKIDALAHFGASVDSCFFIVELCNHSRTTSCDIFNDFNDSTPKSTLGFVDGYVVADIAKFNLQRELLGKDRHYVWRSGIKHDCSKVMELMPTAGGYVNGLHERVALEGEFIFPLLKSSDIGNGRVSCRNVMLVTQSTVGEETRQISRKAPLTWEYLLSHAPLLDKRGSIIYKNKPLFSIFGVGLYSFAPWKVAISGFYKTLKFVKVGPVDRRPVVFDDTIYFLPCWSEDEASFVEALLNTDRVRDFFGSMVHWDEKRPVTVDILKRLSIDKLATLEGRGGDYLRFTSPKNLPLEQAAQGSLFA